MDFVNDDKAYHSGGGGGFASGLMCGSMMNRDNDNGRTSTTMIVLAVVFFLIIFIMGIIALAMFNRDHRRGVGDNGIAEILAATVAAKGIGNNDCNGHNGYHQLYEKMDNNEVKAGIAGIKAEVGALGLYLTKEVNDAEKSNLQNFAKIENQLGMQSQALSQVLQYQNSEMIVKNTIDGVIMRLMKPCAA